MDLLWMPLNLEVNNVKNLLTGPLRIILINSNYKKISYFVFLSYSVINGIAQVQYERFSYS